MTGRRIRAGAHRAVLFAALWLALSGAEPAGLVPGAVLVAGSVWLSLRLMPPRRPLRLWRLVAHLPWFLGNSVLGGVDVARRALAPSMPLRPGWRRVQVALPPGGRVALGGELSLMPGTLAAGTQGGALLVHLLDTDAPLDRAIAHEERALAAMTERAGNG